eukprot:COSAG04_NODE_1445_length_6714_cov_1.982162_6_plen_541_part_00
MDAEAIAAAFSKGTAEERERGYASLEGAVRAAPPSGGGKDEAVTLAAACARALMSDVLCAPASKVNRAEYLRASLLLFEMCKLDAVAVGGKDQGGTLLHMTLWLAPDTVLSEMLAKPGRDWTHDDAVLAAAQMAAVVPMNCVGWSGMLAERGLDEMLFLDAWMSACPFTPGGDRAQPADKFVAPALLLLDLVRSEADSQPEGVIAGAWDALSLMALGNAIVAKAVFEAGMLDVFQQTMRRYSPMERVSRRTPIATGAFLTFKEVTATLAGAADMEVHVVQPMLDAGAVDIAISTLTAYQMLGNPDEASVCAVAYGALAALEMLNLGSPQAQPIVDKLHSAGVDSFRYLLDHPLVFAAAFGLETGSQATKISALVWGRDDDGLAGLTFKQHDMDKIVSLIDHRGPLAGFAPMREDHGQAILSLCISDINKELLLKAEGLIPLLVDSLLLDPEHPRMENVTLFGRTDWETVKGPVQRVRRLLTSAQHLTLLTRDHLHANRTLPPLSPSSPCSEQAARRCCKTRPRPRPCSKSSQKAGPKKLD